MMPKKFRGKKFVFGLAIILVVGAIAINFLFVQQVTSQSVNRSLAVNVPLKVRYNPPSTLTKLGTGRRRAGATRGSCPAVEQPLTALVPESKQEIKAGNSSLLNSYESAGGLTATKYPSFWFYNPYELSAKVPLEFILEDEGGNYIYKNLFTASLGPGIIRIGLLSTGKALEIGRIYHWYFVVDCAPDNSVSVDGWIELVVAPSQSADIWFDRLDALAQQRQAFPQNISIAQNWMELLRSVGLDAIANVPITQCCATETKVGVGRKNGN